MKSIWYFNYKNNITPKENKFICIVIRQAIKLHFFIQNKWMSTNRTRPVNGYCLLWETQWPCSVSRQRTDRRYHLMAIKGWIPSLLKATNWLTTLQPRSTFTARPTHTKCPYPTVSNNTSRTSCFRTHRNCVNTVWGYFYTCSSSNVWPSHSCWWLLFSSSPSCTCSWMGRACPLTSHRIPLSWQRHL